MFTRRRRAFMRADVQAVSPSCSWRSNNNYNDLVLVQTDWLTVRESSELDKFFPVNILIYTTECCPVNKAVVIFLCTYANISI